MIDTHSHLDGEEFVDDLHEVLQRAQSAGVEKIFLPNINGQTLARIRQLCLEHAGYLYPMIGLHPEDVNPETTDIEAVLQQMEQELQQEHHPYIAVGEIGLDFYWDTTFRQQQLEVFERQVEWGIRYNLPLMIHARNAHRELVEIIARHQHPQLRGVFHCFTGTANEAEELLQFPNFVLGIGGVLTFKKSQLPEVLRQSVPLSRIVLETDSPYMAPVPHRGQRNESAFVVEVAKKMAEIYGCDMSEVDAVTTQNVNRIFALG